MEPGWLGTAFTVTFVVAGTLVQPLCVTVSVYVPLAETVADVMVGFCDVDVKPLGPLHE
jgi:hypothetical protein